jgi:hypothetical protein
MKCVYNYKFKKWTPVAQMNEWIINVKFIHLSIYILFYLYNKYKI